MSTFAQIRVSRVVHNKLTGSLLSSTFRWLDTTPTSRIIARCTQDIQSIDGPLVRMTNHFIAKLVMCLSRLIAIAFSAPAFILPGFVIGSLGGLLGQIYIKAQLSVKRERSIAKVDFTIGKEVSHMC
jgi:ABC-type multidrug transport system fused ATPase/permease subunit